MRTHASESMLSTKIVLLFSHLQKHLWHSCFEIPFWAKLLKTLDHTVVLTGLRTPLVDTFEVWKDAHEVVNGVSCKERTFETRHCPQQFPLAAGWTGNSGADFPLERTNAGLPTGHSSVHSCWAVCTPTVPAFRCFSLIPKGGCFIFCCRACLCITQMQCETHTHVDSVILPQAHTAHLINSAQHRASTACHVLCGGRDAKTDETTLSPVSQSATKDILIQLDQPPESWRLALKNCWFFSKIKISLQWAEL